MPSTSVQLTQVNTASIAKWQEIGAHPCLARGWVNHHLPQSLVALWALGTEVSIDTFSCISWQRWGTAALSHQMYSPTSLKTHSHPAMPNRSVMDDGRPFQSRYFIHPWNKQTVLGGEPDVIRWMFRWDVKGIPASPARGSQAPAAFTSNCKTQLSSPDLLLTQLPPRLS